MMRHSPHQQNQPRRLTTLVFRAKGVLLALGFVVGGGIEGHAQEPFMAVTVEEESGRVLLELPPLDEDVLYLNALATGLGSTRVFGLDGAGGGDVAVVRFERHGPRVMMIRQNVTMTAGDGSAGQLEGVERGFPVSVLAAFSIADASGGRIVVDATDFLLSDAVDVRGTVRNAGLGEIRLEPDRAFVKAEDTGAFPRNTEIRTVLTFSSDALHPELSRHAPDGRSITFEQQHSFMALPDEPMPARVFDPRTGNSNTVLHDYSQGFDGDYRVRYTNRYRLEPTDPEAYLRGEVVDPVEPIVLYLDRAIEEPYRTAYREGIEWWNQIFESAGWRNAVQVRDLPDRADPMDVRYSVVMLVNRSVPGPSTGGGRNDPRTGEILVSMPRMDSHRSHTDFNLYMGLMPAFDATGTEPQLGPEEFAMARRRQLAAHEVGHTIGFPHNFIAQAQGRSSVMDYPFPKIDVDGQGRFDISEAYREGGGWSDTLSVRYAYTWYPSAEAEAEGLAEIVQEAIDRGHVSMSDGGISNSYPEVSRWVVGESMFESLEGALAVRREALRHFDEAAIRPGEPLAWLNARFAHVYLHHRYAMEGLVKYVGGMHYRFALRGDGQEPTRTVPGARQREALDRIVEVLSPTELAVPAHIPGLIPPPPPGFREPAGWVNPAGVSLPPAVGSHALWIESPAGSAFDPFAVARSFAQEVVDNLFHRERMTRVVALHGHDATLPSLDEVFAALVQGTWGAGGSRSGADGLYRRAAERSVLDGLFTLAIDEQATSDVRDAALLHLARLGERITDTPVAGEDAAYEAHRHRAAREIDRYLRLGEIPALRTGVIQIPLPWP